MYLTYILSLNVSICVSYEHLSIDAKEPLYGKYQKRHDYNRHFITIDRDGKTITKCHISEGSGDCNTFIYVRI